MSLVDTSRVRKLAKRLAKSGQAVEHVIQNAAEEVKKHAMPEGLPANFKAAVHAVPDFAVELVDRLQAANLSAGSYRPLLGVPASAWTQAFKRIEDDHALQKNWQAAQAGNVEAQAATDSTFAKILKDVGIVGDAGMAVGTLVLGAGVALICAGVPLSVPSVGLSEVPGATVLVVGAIIFGASGLLWLLANLILVWVE